MVLEELIDKNKLILIACVSAGVAALLFVQKITTPVKSNSSINNPNNSRNHATHVRTRRVRRELHALPMQQGIASLTHNNSNTSSNNVLVKPGGNSTGNNVQQSNHAHLHRRHNSSGANNTTMTSKTAVTSYRESQEHPSSNNTQHNISDLQRSQTVNRSTGALSLLSRSSARNRSESRQLHERSVSPLANTQLSDNTNALLHSKEVDCAEPNQSTSTSTLPLNKMEHKKRNNDDVDDDDGANNKVTLPESILPENVAKIERKGNNKSSSPVTVNSNAKIMSTSMQNSDACNTNSNNNNRYNNTHNRSKERGEGDNENDEKTCGSQRSVINVNEHTGVVVTKPLTVESLHHLRQQGEVISPSSSTLTKRSHEHIAAQLSIPVNALQLGKLALPLNKTDHADNNHNHHHTNYNNTQNRKYKNEEQEYTNGVNEMKTPENGGSENEQIVHCEVIESTPQTARAQILPLLQQQQQQQQQEQEQEILATNTSNNNFAEVQKPKLLISKCVQVNLPLKAKQNDLQNKMNKLELHFRHTCNEINHLVNKGDDDDDTHDGNNENKSNGSNHYNTNTLEGTQSEEKLNESDGEDDNYQGKNDLDIVIAEEDAMDISPIPHQPSNEHSPLVSHWAELSPSMEHEQVIIPEHLLSKVERQVVLLIEQIYQNDRTNTRNDSNACSTSEEYCWMQLYNYLMSIPTNAFSSLMCRFAKQERIVAFVNEFNKRDIDVANKELSQSLLTLEEVKKEVILMLSSNITIVHNTHFTLVSMDNNKYCIHKVRGKFEPILIDASTNESPSRVDSSDLQQSHRTRRFVSVTVASDSDSDVDACDKRCDINNDKKQSDRANATNSNDANILLRLVGSYSYLESGSSNVCYKTIDKERNDNVESRWDSDNCSKALRSENENTNKRTETVITGNEEHNNAALSEDVVHLLHNLTAIVTNRDELTLLCASTQGSHLAKELAELATSAQHVLSSCTTQTSSRSKDASSPYTERQEEEKYKEQVHKGRVEYDAMAPITKTLSAPPSLPVLANTCHSTENGRYNQIADEQTPQQQKLHRSSAINRESDVDDNDNNNDNKHHVNNRKKKEENAHLDAEHKNDISDEMTFDNISPAQSCPQKVYGSEVKANNYPHRPTIRSRRSRSNSPPANTFSNGITETSPNSKLFSLSRSPFTIDITNDENRNNSNISNNLLNVSDDFTDHHHGIHKLEQTNNLPSHLTKQSVFERLYSQSSNTKSRKV